MEGDGMEEAMHAVFDRTGRGLQREADSFDQFQKRPFATIAVVIAAAACDRLSHHRMMAFTTARLTKGLNAAYQHDGRSQKMRFHGFEILLVELGRPGDGAWREQSLRYQNCLSKQ